MKKWTFVMDFGPSVAPLALMVDEARAKPGVALADVRSRVLGRPRTGNENTRSSQETRFRENMQIYTMRNALRQHKST